MPACSIPHLIHLAYERRHHGLKSYLNKCDRTRHLVLVSIFDRLRLDEISRPCAQEGYNWIWSGPRGHDAYRRRRNNAIADYIRVTRGVAAQSKKRITRVQRGSRPEGLPSIYWREARACALVFAAWWCARVSLRAAWLAGINCVISPCTVKKNQSGEVSQESKLVR